MIIDTHAHFVPAAFREAPRHLRGYRGAIVPASGQLM